MSRGSFLVFWLVLASATCNYTNVLWEHRCDPGSAVFACSIPNFLYKPGQNSSRVIEPDGTVMRRISMRLKRPRAVEIVGTRMKMVEIPIDLEYGVFGRGDVKYVVVPPSETAYPLRYLDLDRNNLADIRNLSTLVNLETLILSRNRLPRLTNQVFQRMTNLTTLSISKNHIIELSLSMLPPRLEKLFVNGNGLLSVDFSDAYLPALEVLTLSSGSLTDLNVTAVLAVAPKLKKIMLLYNDFGLQKEINISATLKAAGVAYDEGLGEEQTDDYAYESNDEDDNDDDSFYRDGKVRFWEHTFTWLLAIGNTIVLVWAVVEYYKGK